MTRRDEVLLMWRALGLSLVALTLCSSVSGQDGRVGVALAPGDLWVRDVTVVSPERAGPLPHAHVIVRRSRILSVGTDAPRAGAAGVTVVAGEGRYLVPGLIDGHVHLAGVPGMTPEHEAKMPKLVEAYERQLPRSYLYFGFTTVIDLNVVDRKRVDRIRSAEIGPAVFDCDNALALANGYPMVYAPAARRFEMYRNFLYDPRQSTSIPEKYSAKAHSPEAAVGRVAAAGSVCVKAHYEPGFDPAVGRLPVPTTELMRQVRDAAHARALPLLLHANSLDAHRFAVDVGADAVVHGMWNRPAATSASDPLPDSVREVLDAEVRSRLAYMPTMQVLNGLTDLFDPMFLDRPALAKVLPAELIAWYRTQEGRWFAREIAPGFAGQPPERLLTTRRAAKPNQQRATAYIVKQGGRIAFGSDTPSAPTYANPPGYNGFLELQELEGVGLPPDRILAAATLENARLFRLENDYGTIAAGKMASMLLLRNDPLKSSSAYDSIEWLVVKGRVIPRGNLAVK